MSASDSRAYEKLEREAMYAAYRLLGALTYVAEQEPELMERLHLREPLAEWLDAERLRSLALEQLS